MDSTDSREYVFVEISGHEYALPIESVREVLPMLEPTPMPSWPETVLGIIDIRGELMPLVDVAPILGRPSSAISPKQFVVIFFQERGAFGIVVDRVSDVRRAPKRRTEGLALKAGQGDPLFDDLVKGTAGTVVVLDPARLAPTAQLPN